MNITKYIKHFDSLTYLHVLGITRSGGHTLISGNFRYISANFRSETGSEMLFDQSSMWTEWPPPRCGRAWRQIRDPSRFAENTRTQHEYPPPPCGRSAGPLHVDWVPAPSMWAEGRPPPCGLSARPLHVGSVCGLQSGASRLQCHVAKLWLCGWRRCTAKQQPRSVRSCP